MARQLYELCGADPARIFSPYCWRSRLALAHKGLAFESIPWRFTETARLDFAKHDKVPVLVDGDAVVVDSWTIAQHLDEAHPDGPSLLHGRPESYRFIAHWTDSVVSAGIARMIVSDIPALLDPEAQAYFVASREKRYGRALAEVTADRDAFVLEFRRNLYPLRRTVEAQPFLGGSEPDYADHIAFGSFMWARVTSRFALLAEGDAVAGWVERMLDLYGGLARATPPA
jgi:glutathione S-transferase